ncbi:MAG: FAD-dependent oxidoreductase [Myxococcales bacterium]|nr:FAD-dependent oxidoreductase [Myxococcales bacterium]
MPFPATSFPARVVAARTLSPSVRELTLEREGESFDFDPGQWVNVFVDIGGSELKRSYSIASPPNGSGRFDLAVTRVTDGPMSEQLHRMQIGETVRAVGPSGLFTRAADDPRPALFVGTGTGITPLRSMIMAAVAAGSRAPFSVLLGFRNEADILYADDLAAWRALGADVSVTLSKPHAGWQGLTGYVQEHLAEKLSALGGPDGPSGNETHIYVCGLEKMVTAVRDRAKNELGVPRKQIHQERFD